ncbi:MAG: hypothetical protein COV43_03365 [Deltaproteobacteria bacterium CG11_big_fil_rev_8_21_14_0_20_42_23]|nr:MAG: hypothetical protein COV43_03365 [Deltaproteobacteria bacterium CG11_big_fil_rev_8_21_14_0_20_42_23]PJC63815.1 MAG: hypothetical protein CO021_07980 [Deltaproteobacteria bacterium CG_4_9_14_0_2_um_filter_42_21]
MANVCEITRKKSPKAEAGKKSVLQKRKIELPEFKTAYRLHVSEEGLKVLKDKGGLASFLKEQDEKKLSAKLQRVKRKHGLVKQEEKKAEEAPAAETVPAASEETVAE